MEGRIPIYVADEEAAQFLVFRENFELWQAIAEAGVPGLGWGKAVLNFAHGELQNVQVERVAWKRGQ